MYPFHKGTNEIVKIIPFVTDSIKLTLYLVKRVAWNSDLIIHGLRLYSFPFANENVNDSYQIPINCAKSNRD